MQHAVRSVRSSTADSRRSVLRIILHSGIGMELAGPFILIPTFELVFEKAFGIEVFESVFRIQLIKDGEETTEQSW
jgi:hypothetical protein